MTKRKGYDVFEVVQLFLRSFGNDFSKDEREKYEHLLKEPGVLNNGDKLGDNEYLLSELKREGRFHADVAYRKLEIHMRRGRKSNMKRELWAAAIVLPLMIVGLGVLFMDKKVDEPKGQVMIASVSPKAYITLANGVQVDLVKSGERDIRERNGTLITHDSCCVVYSQQKSVEMSEELIYNELNVPRGGEYMLVLSDGTEIWVNADSRLKFPVHFVGKSRDVYLDDGEVYLKVVRDENNPFRVHTSRGTITVLGTEFNVRAYADESSVATTLVEGSVKYRDKRDAGKVVILKPGEQVVAEAESGDLHVREVNLRELIGWKDGQYVFYDATLEELMRMIERVYDVTVFFVNPEVRQYRFSGDLEKYKEVELFLRYIETGGDVQFVVKDKTINVYKKTR